MSKLGIWIPSEILDNKKLNNTDKIVYGLIRSFANKGSCFASNKVMSNLICVSIPTISRSISKLKKLELIRVRLVYKINSKEINKRIIKLSSAKSDDNKYIWNDAISMMKGEGLEYNNDKKKNKRHESNY